VAQIDYFKVADPPHHVFINMKFIKLGKQLQIKKIKKKDIEAQKEYRKKNPPLTTEEFLNIKFNKKKVIKEVTPKESAMFSPRFLALNK
jgi:hypothetical protein